MVKKQRDQNDHKKMRERESEADEKFPKRGGLALILKVYIKPQQIQNLMRAGQSSRLALKKKKRRRACAYFRRVGHWGSWRAIGEETENGRPDSRCYHTEGTKIGGTT